MPVTRRNRCQTRARLGKKTRLTWPDGTAIDNCGYSAHGKLQTVAVPGYGYDPQHRRLWKEHFKTPSGQALPQAQRTYYLYADEGLITEATQSITLQADGSVTATTTPVISTQYGPRPDNPFGTGVLFIKTQNALGQDTLAYYHHDHPNTPIAASDKAGNVVWAAYYDPFGQASIITPAATASAPTISSNLRLPGQYWDAESGLHYNWHRYYEPGVGRYITADPIGLEGGINAFAYVGGRPLGVSDPLGLWGTAAHNAILRAAFPNLAPHLLAAVLNGSDNVDLDQSTMGAPFHAMTRPEDGGNRLAIAKRDVCIFINDRMTIYNRFANSSQPSEQFAAYFALGQALHPVMDSTSPVHGWAQWGTLTNIRNWAAARKHGDGSSSLENLSALTPELLAKTIGLINQTMTTNPCACTQ